MSDRRTFLGMPFTLVGGDDSSLTVRYQPDAAAHRGPEGRVHGGLVLAACDHAGAALGHRLGFAVFTARIDIRLRDGVPLDLPFDITARLLRRRPRALEVGLEVSSEGKRRADGSVLLVTRSASQ